MTTFGHSPQSLRALAQWSYAVLEAFEGERAKAAVIEVLFKLAKYKGSWGALAKQSLSVLPQAFQPI